MRDELNKEELNNINPTSRAVDKRYKFINIKSLPYILITIIVVVLLSYASLYTYDNYISKNNANNTLGCSDRVEGSILYKANKIFKENPDSVTKEQLDPLIQDIKKIDNYKSDSNCLYPVIFSYILDNNFNAANEELDNFARVYNDGSNFANDIYPMQNLDDFKRLIVFSLEIQKNNNIVPTPNNVTGFGEPINESPEEINR
jgi:hypothetical protein